MVDDTEAPTVEDATVDVGQPPERPSGFIAPGTRIGRYELRTILGRGGFGSVYSAYDPELLRDVAIKLLRPSVSARIDPQEARARMLREAQALAALSHPNVVAIYDVGAHEDHVFVAMELVDGVTLRKWRDEAARDWSAIRDVYVQAARGLEAAHARGIVHRDFKPDNVLVGNDGRARVLDFGLARQPTSSGGGLMSMSLTQTGALMGTPAYMAPEQLVSGTATASSDQFSFCVSLFEALYGARPFPSATFEELHDSVIRGLIVTPPGVDVPAWLATVVRCGLAVQPSHRFVSITELIEALAGPREPRRRPRWPITAAVAAISTIAIGAIIVRATRTSAPPPGVLDGDFERTAIGAAPALWQTPTEAYVASVVGEGCRHGARCLLVSRTSAALAPDAVADISQPVEANGYRGKRVRFRASLRTEGSDAALTWIRVDRGAGVGFMYNTGDRPVRSATWTEVDIVAAIAADATSIDLGVVHLGNGRTWIDAVSLELAADNTPLSGPPILPAPSNRNFEGDLVGAAPGGWEVSPFSIRAFRVLVTDASPLEGSRSLEIVPMGAMTADTTVPVLAQRFDATRWRGKTLTVTMQTRVEEFSPTMFVEAYDRYGRLGGLEEPIEEISAGAGKIGVRGVVPTNAEYLVISIVAGAARAVIDDLVIESN